MNLQQMAAADGRPWQAAPLTHPEAPRRVEVLQAALDQAAFPQTDLDVTLSVLMNVVLLGAGVVLALAAVVLEWLLVMAVAVVCFALPLYFWWAARSSRRKVHRAWRALLRVEKLKPVRIDGSGRLAVAVKHSQSYLLAVRAEGLAAKISGPQPCRITVEDRRGKHKLVTHFLPFVEDFRAVYRRERIGGRFVGGSAL